SGPKTSIICSPMTSLKTSIKTITYLSDTGCLEIQGASLKRKKHHFLLDIENLSYTQCSKFLLPHRKRFPTIVDIINGDGYG
ncbi:hypothetical protein, partial [Escherichia coli]|uniref:hypothetical protein n=1 Tax=Escherichia coli TaxID=562 RepID=UPI001BB20513